MKGFNLGDLVSLLIVFAVYLIAAGFGKKKKGGKKRSPMRSRARGEQRDARAAKRDEQTHAGFGDAFARAAAPEQKKDACCRTQQMHLHEVTARQFASAGEGEDPCHVGGVAAQDEIWGEAPSMTDDTLAQDVLRGVIMSEILMRPQDRAALKRGRR